MSAILPPANRLWWKQPLERIEITWIVIAFIWCLIMFFMMPYWHVYGKQNLSNETYRTTPDTLHRQDAGDGRQVHGAQRDGHEKIPVVRPPAGSDVYLIARLWSCGRSSSWRRARATACT